MMFGEILWRRERGKKCVRSGGEAVGRDGAEGPDGEGRESGFRAGKGQTEVAVGSEVEAGGEGDGIVEDAFEDAGIEEKAELVLAGGGVGDRNEVLGDFQLVRGGLWIVEEIEEGIFAGANREVEKFVGEGQLEFGGRFFELEFHASFMTRAVVGSEGRKGPRSFAERFEFFGELDLEIACVVEREDARKGHAAGPTGGTELRLGTRFGNPAPEDAAIVGSELAFGSVEITVVEKAAFLRMEDEFFGVEFARLPEDFAFGGVEEEIFLAEREKIGALPHFGRVDGIGGLLTVSLAGSERMRQRMPFAEIGGAIEKDLAAHAAFTGADAHEPRIGLAPEEGIAEAGEIWILRRKQNGIGKFFPGEELGISGSGEALGFEEIMGAIAKSGFSGRNGFDAGVEKCGDAVVDDGAAGEAAVGVWAAGSGSQRDGEMFPVDHVWADGMVPVHVTPNGGVGVVLKEHVVVAVPEDGAVGIVHPVAFGEEMELGTERVGGELGWGDGIVQKRNRAAEGKIGEGENGSGTGESVQEEAAGKQVGCHRWIPGEG